MSIKAMSRVWELDIRHAQQAVLLAMADHGDDDGRKVYPSAGLIGWKCGYSKRQVQRIIDDMVMSGLLEWVCDARGWRPTEYRICFENATVKTPYQPDRKGRGDKSSPHRPGDQQRQAVVPAGGQDVTPEQDEANAEMSPPGATPEASRGDTQMSPRTLEPSKQPPLEADQPAAALLRDDLLKLSDRLATAIRANEPKASLSPRSISWLDPLRLLIDRDGRTVEEVAAVIDWCQADEFWRTNVLSPSKLRKKFTQLRLRMAEQGPARATARSAQSDRDAAALDRMMGAAA